MWAGDCGAALGSVAAAISVIHGTQYLGNAATTGLDAFVDRITELMCNVFDKIHNTLLDESKSPIENQMENECEAVIGGIDRMRTPIIRHIKRSEDGTLQCSSKATDAASPLIIGDPDSVKAAQLRLAKMTGGSAMAPYRVLVDCIMDDSVAAAGGTPCVIRFRSFSGREPPYCDRQIMKVKHTILGVSIKKPKGDLLSFGNVRYEINTDGSIHALK